MATKSMAPHLGGELGQKLANPLKFQGIGGGGESLPTVHGFDVTLLIDLCKVHNSGYSSSLSSCSFQRVSLTTSSTPTAAASDNSNSDL
jgi:hypothetical protein